MKISPKLVALLSFFLVIIDVIFEKFGTYPHYSSGRYSSLEMLGVIFPLIALTLPIFIKKYRKAYWCKQNLILLVLVLIIDIVLLSITYTNKEYYWTAWVQENHWDRNNCPPIRWDIWNIIGKHS